MYEQILYDVTDPVATITLNRPKQLNAWTNRMGDEVRHAVARAEEADLLDVCRGAVSRMAMISCTPSCA